MTDEPAAKTRGQRFGATAMGQRPPVVRRVINLGVLPSLFTLGNGIAGFAAIVSLAKAYTFVQLPGHGADAANAMLHGVAYIGLAGLFDGLDGRVARLTGTEGAFGAELDSLCDAISFGVAPGFLLRVLGEAHFGSGISEAPAPVIRLLWLVAALYIACAVLRLARFNVETSGSDDHRSFRGLPTPAAAGGCVALFLIGWHFRDKTTGHLAFSDAMTVVIPLLGGLFALLMVSRVRFIHVFNRVLSGPRTVWSLVLFLAIAGSIWVFAEDSWELVAAGVLLGYVASGPIYTAGSYFRHVFRRGRRVRFSQRMRQISDTGRDRV